MSAMSELRIEAEEAFETWYTPPEVPSKLTPALFLVTKEVWVAAANWALFQRGDSPPVSVSKEPQGTQPETETRP